MMTLPGSRSLKSGDCGIKAGTVAGILASSSKAARAGARRQRRGGGAQRAAALGAAAAQTVTPPQCGAANRLQDT
eukprot:2272901-Rhodomonas_salina.3